MMELWYSLLNCLPFEWLHFEFMKNALLAIILVSPIFALLGCLVINCQMSFFSDAIGHAALAGIAIGTLAGLANPLWAMITFSFLLTLLVVLFKRYSKASTDTIIGLLMSFSVALGIVILSKYGGFNKYSKFLIGDILTITPSEIMMLVCVLAVVVATWIFFFNKIFLVSLNKSLALSRGIQVWKIEFLFTLLVALVVTICIQWVGLLVINSLLILPAAASKNISRNISQYTFFAVIFSVISGIGGLIISYYAGTATGATIVLVAMAFFVASFIIKLEK